MPIQYEGQARAILMAFKIAGDEGLTLKVITRLMKDQKLGVDCLNWINTFIEAGIIIKFGQIGGLDLYRLTETGLKSLE